MEDNGIKSRQNLRERKREMNKESTEVHFLCKINYTGSNDDA